MKYFEPNIQNFTTITWNIFVKWWNKLWPNRD